MLLSNCAVCGSKKSRFIKEQEASELLSSLEIRKPFSQIPLVDHLLFQKYKIDGIINKFLLARNKFMPEMHLRQPDLRTKLVEHLLKTKKEFKKIKKQDSKYLSKRTRCSFFFYLRFLS